MLEETGAVLFFYCLKKKLMCIYFASINIPTEITEIKV